MTTKIALTLALLAPALAWAQPMHHGPPPEERTRVERKMRMLRVVELADRLELDEKGALKLAEQMEKFADRRRQLHEEMRKHHETVRRAAEGDAEAGKNLETAVRQAIVLRKSMSDVDLEEWIALGTGLNAQQKARLGIFIAEWPRAMHKMAREVHKERRVMRRHERERDDD